MREKPHITANQCHAPQAPYPDELLAPILYATDGIAGRAGPMPNRQDEPTADRLFL